MAAIEEAVGGWPACPVRGGNAGGGETAREALWPDKQGQELNAGGCAAEGCGPVEGGAEVTVRGEGARRTAVSASRPWPPASASLRRTKPRSRRIHSPAVSGC